jgi:hypothetical protein
MEMGFKNTSAQDFDTLSQDFDTSPQTPLLLERGFKKRVF